MAAREIVTDAGNVGKAVAGGGRYNKGDEIKNRDGVFTEVLDFSWTDSHITFRLADGTRRRYAWSDRIEVRRHH